MEKYLFITKNHNGSYTIKDSVTDIQVTYYDYTLRQAIKKHRQNMNIQRRHFTKIYL
jgi:hypothetical protein